MSTVYLNTLPIEILYHIIDYLDIETIFFSFRSVCKHFYSIVNSYNNYDFNFESISKSNFNIICRMIPFEQVISLTLSNKDKTHGQIPLFLSLFNLTQFNRLRSLKLIQIEDNDLKLFLNSIIHLSSLISFSIDLQTLNIRKNTSLNLLSSTINDHSFQQLDLNMWPKDMTEFQWSINSTINYLRIRNSITIKQFYIILQHCPCLQTMILKDFNIDDNSEYVPTDIQFFQLKSLTCMNGRIEMSKIEQCLSLIPKLIHLKLIGHGSLFNSTFDGYRWEQIFLDKLPLLKKFEFFISVLTDVHFDTNNIKQIISFFQTPFWLNEKQCFVICDYIIYLHKLILYSIPICHNHFEYYSNLNKVSASNFLMKDKNSLIMNNIKQLDLDLSQVINNNENSLSFQNVNELIIGINGEWPKDSLTFLSTTINLLNLVKLSLSVHFSHEYMPSIISGTNKLLKYAVNIHTLALFDYLAPQNCTTNMETVCLILTSNIKHLHIRVKNSDDMKYIIDNVKYLKSVTFEYPQNFMFHHQDCIDYLSVLKEVSSIWECQYALHVWLSQN
ncbi:unnamed protein product [Adineta steineri]|uniref:F-box domain-containing protein n=1 Tax=Adineta steineri TaxID=433720 RepID=A0A814YXZ5_9BILA|nr:unnamed protein product [Adineta steineri]CAF1579718.1 unnamed protein product [Adineta steineri]